MTPQKTNRLANETSPYLLQHAHNPVDWFPWGEEAFEKARSENLPIFLSVGYSACHWCHVMERESFENEDVAKFINAHFVSIKVDREERPDVDRVYMDFVQAMTQQGGWPMTVFMTPDGQPFFGGTYFPPHDGYGRPGFLRLLHGLHDAWENQHEEVLQSATQMVARMQQVSDRMNAAQSSAELLKAATANPVADNLHNGFDPQYGGFGHAPKFPSPTTHEFILAHGMRRSPDSRDGFINIVTTTLDGMRKGGIQDHLGGGFSRYSVDHEWLVPHFEKMLYDNAQLARLYLHGWQCTDRPEYLAVVRNTLAYMRTDLRSDEGCFYTAEDADSEGIEGKFYVWTDQEIETLLGEDAELAKAWYGVDSDGNFTDPHHPDFGRRTVLHLPEDAATCAERFNMDVPQLEARIETIRTQMLTQRASRVRPGLDDKSLTSWNALALAAFAECGRVLNDPELIGIAEETAAFFEEHLRSDDGGLYHCYKAGHAHVTGQLEDHSLTGLAYLELFKATGTWCWYERAVELWDHIMAHYWDEQAHCFYSTADNAEALVLRPREYFDGAMPSGNGSAALLGAWIARYQARPEAHTIVETLLCSALPMMGAGAGGFGCLWQAFELLMAPSDEVVIVGDAQQRTPFEREIAGHFLPHTAIFPCTPGVAHPLASGRDEPGRAYRCIDKLCASPATSPEQLRDQLVGV